MSWELVAVLALAVGLPLGVALVWLWVDSAPVAIRPPLHVWYRWRGRWLRYDRATDQEG